MNYPLRILLLGKNGQVGWELQRSLSLLGHLTALDRHSPDFCGDLTNLHGLRMTIDAIKPDVIVNAAAYTAVDQAETDPDAARAINAAAPHALAQAARQIGALLVHYSTDYVFDGSLGMPWREADIPAPLNVYGATKLEGEQGIIAVGGRFLILRTSWVYAARGGNFAKTMLRLAKERSTLNVIDDQFGSPTGADMIADATAHAIRAALRDQTLCGLYHFSARGETTWYEYARFVLETASAAGVALRVKPGDVSPVPSTAYPTAAVRPKNSRLDTLLFQSRFGLTLPHWEDGVARMLTESLSS